MYGETDLIFPYFQTFSPDFSASPNSNTCLGYNMADYDLGDEAGLFKSPEPVIEQPLDPMIAAMSMITCGSPQELSVTDIRPLEDEEFLNNAFQEYKEILEKEAETDSSPLSEVLNYKFRDEISVVREIVHPPGQIAKSSMDWIHGAQIKPSFLNISEVDFGSDGDIKTPANGNGSSSFGPPQLMSEHIMEDRWGKLSRYRNKKSKRNFGRKIKYACRKVLADSQPRIRGRFAKTE